MVAQWTIKGDWMANSELLVVAIGASHESRRALEEFLSTVPSATPMAFVVIGCPLRSSRLPIEEVRTAASMQAGRVYVPAPDIELTIRDGVLEPSAPTPSPVDAFFSALARDRGPRAAGVLFTTGGSVGRLGLRDIKSALGIALAEDDSIAPEIVDLAVPRGELHQRLLAYHAARPEPLSDATYHILELVHNRTGHPFWQYEVRTMRRLIERRMSLHGIHSDRFYLEYLRANPVEVERLFRDLLAGTTRFFRDPKAWDALAAALTAQLADKPDDYVFHAWVAGCSTGEEAYSLAMTLRELFGKRSMRAVIFATDVDATAVDRARAGHYPSGIAADVGPERLERFFERRHDGFSVKTELRQMVVFTPQNVVEEPPFMKLDLLSCRYLLCELDPSSQGRLSSRFREALDNDGLLFLGTTDSASGSGLVPIDVRSMILRREGGLSNDILDVVHERFRCAVSEAIEEVLATEGEVVREGLESGVIRVDLKVSRVDGRLQVSFIERPRAVPKPSHIRELAPRTARGC
jgi:two-component system CheB/CheR fusion protein